MWNILGFPLVALIVIETTQEILLSQQKWKVEWNISKLFRISQNIFSVIYNFKKVFSLRKIAQIVR